MIDYCERANMSSIKRLSTSENVFDTTASFVPQTFEDGFSKKDIFKTGYLATITCDKLDLINESLIIVFRGDILTHFVRSSTRDYRSISNISYLGFQF